MKVGNLAPAASRFSPTALLHSAWLFGAVLLLSGCFSPPPGVGRLEKVWGGQGTADGSFMRPRAIAIDAEDRLYIVDLTARIQVFDRDGNFLHSWTTPTWELGKPSGLTFNNAGNLLVADTHYHRMLVYTPQGELLEEQTIGGVWGNGPSEFGFVTDAVQDSHGNYYVSDYGEYDRIQKFTPEGEFVFDWGGHGEGPGQFLRPNNLAIDEQDRLWVADSCNHRIQVFNVQGEKPELVFQWGEEGYEPGQMRYPYDLIVLEDCVYVSEFGNHRVQKFTREGKSLGVWGGPGREPGQMCQPWALARDSRGRLHVLDSYNHRVQRILF